MSALDDVKLKIKVLADQHRELHLDELLLPRLDKVATETELRNELHHLAENIGRNPDPKYHAVQGHLGLLNRVIDQEINPLLEPLAQHNASAHSEEGSHQNDRHHSKTHGHDEHTEHHWHTEEDKGEKDKDQGKTDKDQGHDTSEETPSQKTSQRIVEQDEPDEDYDEEPSEEGPLYEPRMPMMPPPVEGSGSEGHADAGLYGDDGSFTPQSAMGEGGSSEGGGDDSQGGGNKKKRGGLPNTVKNQLNKINPLNQAMNKLNPQQLAKDQLGNMAKQALGNAARAAVQALGSAALSALQSLVVFLAPAWPVLVAIAVIMVILIVLVFFGPKSATIPVVCGDFSDQISHFQWLFINNDTFNDTENKLYHLNNHHKVTDPLDPLKDYSGHDTDLLNAEEQVLNTNCLLFGHGKGYLTGANNYTTFAKLLLGDRLDPSQDNGYNEGVKRSCHSRGCMPSTYSGNDYLIDQDILFDDDPHKSAGKCYTTINRDDKQQLFVIAYYNPEHCSDSEFRYQIAESLSHVLILQQEQQYGKGNADILNSFEYGPLLTQKLPVYTCSDSVSRPYGTFNFSPTTTNSSNGVITGENETDEKQRFCFGDMVGEYMVYPSYIPTLEDPKSTPTPTPSDATSSAMTVFNSPLSKYNTGPYKPFYEFARLNLFDGQEMYQLLQGNANAAACPFTSFTPQDELTQLSGWGFKLDHGDNNNPSNSVPIDPIKDQGLIQKTFDTICLLYQSPTYVSLLGANTGSAYNITISFNPANGWGGYTESIHHVKLFGMDNSTNDYYLRFILTHELGHVLQLKNPSLVGKLDDTTGNISLGSLNCPRPDIQKIRYPDVRHAANLAECFSDMMALYLTYPEYASFIKNAPASLSSFGTASEYADLYSFLFHNVFGGVEYVDSGRTKDLATYAKNLNLSIQRSCPPPYTVDPSRIAYVTANDKDCLKTLDFHPAKAVFDELWNDVIPTSGGDLPTLQCVGTVRASTIGIGADIGGNDAGAYADETIPGYQRIGYDPFSKTFSIQTGDILIWAHHIGIAVYVYPDKSVDLAESNIWFPGNDIRPPINGGVWIRSHTPYDTIVSGLRGIQRKE